MQLTIILFLPTTIQILGRGVRNLPRPRGIHGVEKSKRGREKRISPCRSGDAENIDRSRRWRSPKEREIADGEGVRVEVG
jgi:hypothetical protein